MRNNYDAYLFKVLNLFTKKELTAQMLLEIEPDVSVERCKLRKTKFHEKLTLMGSEVTTIVILIQGNCQCSVRSSFGDTITVNTMASPNIFGLMEVVLNIPRYTATVITSQDSYVVEAPVDIFMHAMRNDLIVANACISCFVNLAQYYMDMCQIRSFFGLNDALLLYIFNNCDKSALPYTVKSSRKTMSYQLNINLRTLYRYLGKLRDDGNFDVRKGKIVVTAPQYEKLREYCEKSLGTQQVSAYVYPTTFQDHDS